MTYVYWIHYPDHTDPMTEGYIGITCNPEDRFPVHRRTFTEYFENGAVIDILHECQEREEAYKIEADYRPLPNTGWNNYSGSIKRITESKPQKSTTHKNGIKLFNLRVPIKLLADFHAQSKEMGVSTASRLKDFMESELVNFRPESTSKDANIHE